MVAGARGDSDAHEQHEPLGGGGEAARLLHYCLINHLTSLSAAEARQRDVAVVGILNAKISGPLSTAQATIDGGRGAEIHLARGMLSC